MQLPYSEELEIQYLSRLFDNTSECYKFFWFQAIVTKVLEGKSVLTYEELIDEMIADAWYMVTEYHLNLGPRDTLERVVHDIQKISGMKSSEKKSVVIEYLNHCQDPEINRQKRNPSVPGIASGRCQQRGISHPKDEMPPGEGKASAGGGDGKNAR